jgi:cyclophilin family peptidyl-prolyl cis-trans isomerase
MSDNPTSDAAIAACDEFISSQSIDTSAKRWRLDLQQPPAFDLGASKTYFWDIETNKGKIRVKLLQNVAPRHVSSTIYLTRLGFYDGLKFHRVITGFMAQGGCPLGTGTGGPGYEYDGEFSPDARHDRGGLLSMANAGAGTDGSQFFLTFVATPHLDDKHTIFGEVTDGDDTLKALEALGSGSGKTKEELRMEKCTISVE